MGETGGGGGAFCYGEAVGTGGSQPAWRQALERLWRNPIAFVVAVEIAVVVVLGPLDAWVRPHLGRTSRTLLNAAYAAVVVFLFVRGGWWRRAGGRSRPGLLLAALVIAVAGAYLVLRVATWHDFSIANIGFALAGAAAVATEEELIFRGWILGTLEPRYGTVKAVLASSVLFGIAHFASLFHDTPLTWAASRVVWATCIGVFAAGLLKVSGTYWAPITAHALFNFIDTLTWRPRARVFEDLGASLDMLVAAPVIALIGAFLCFEGLRTVQRTLAALVCTAGIAMLLLATLGGDAHSALGSDVAFPTAPRVIRLEHGGQPTEMDLWLAVPKAWGGRLLIKGVHSTSMRTPGGSNRVEILVPDGALPDIRGEEVTSLRLTFPEAGPWDVQVNFKGEVIWERHLEIGTDAPTTEAGAGR